MEKETNFVPSSMLRLEPSGGKSLQFRFLSGVVTSVCFILAGLFIPPARNSYSTGPWVLLLVGGVCLAAVLALRLYLKRLGKPHFVAIRFPPLRIGQSFQFFIKSDSETGYPEGIFCSLWCISQKWPKRYGGVEYRVSQHVAVEDLKRGKDIAFDVPDQLSGSVFSPSSVVTWQLILSGEELRHPSIGYGIVTYELEVLDRS